MYTHCADRTAVGTDDVDCSHTMVPSTDPSKENGSRRRVVRKGTKSGVRKFFPKEETGEKPTQKAFRTNESRLTFPPGPVIQIHSTRMRSLVDTFLRNTSTVQTEFRAILQGPGGGFQGEMIAVVIGHIENDACSAAVAMLPDGKWLVHSINEISLTELLDRIPSRFKPLRIEGGVEPVKQAIQHARFEKRPAQYTIDCLHLETTGKITHNPGGLHRLARHSDIPRLDEYAGEFETMKESMPRPNWEMLISENRILLGIVEGTVASVAIRGPGTLDRVLIDGVYTFKSFRGRGLARKLVAALAQQAEGRNQTAAVVVGTKNKPMIALLEELDFHKTADYLIAVFEGEKQKADRLLSE